MGNLIFFTAVSIVTAGCTEVTASAADEKANLNDVAVSSLLTELSRTSILPKGVVVRVSSNLTWRSGSDPRSNKVHVWEFNRSTVKDVSGSPETDKAQQRISSFDSTRVCKDLLSSDLINIARHTNVSKDARPALVMEGFDEGSRSIEIFRDGRRILNLKEQIGEFGFSPTQAIQFATLHERLSSQGEAAFCSLPGQNEIWGAAKSKTWPSGLLVRLHADIYLRDGGKFTEAWEMTGNKVHKIKFETDGSRQRLIKRTHSLECNTDEVCTDIIQRRGFEIQASDSAEAGVLLADRPGALGGRSIEVFFEGEPVLELHEHCTFGGYGHTQAVAFASLYETLANRARSAFRLHANQSK